MSSEIKLSYMLKLIHFHVGISQFAVVRNSGLKIQKEQAGHIFYIHIHFFTFQVGIFQISSMA